MHTYDPISSECALYNVHSNTTSCNQRRAQDSNFSSAERTKNVWRHTHFTRILDVALKVSGAGVAPTEIDELDSVTRHTPVHASGCNIYQTHNFVSKMSKHCFFYFCISRLVRNIVLILENIFAKLSALGLVPT